MAHSSLSALVGAVSVALSSSIALAQGADKTAAVALFDEAERLFAEGNYADACPRYAESNRLDPQLGALMHAADCYEKAGQLASAWASFRDAAEIAERKGDPRSATATVRASALEPRLARLTVLVPKEAAAAGLEVRRDGVALNSAIWGSAIPVDPGEHTVEASAPGKIAWKGNVAVAGEGKASISVPVLADVPVEAPPEGASSSASGSPDSAPAADSAAKPGGTQRLLGWSAVGAGGVGLILGVVFELKKSGKVTDRDAICPTGKGCSPQEGKDIANLTSEARSAHTVGLVGLIAGTLLVGGGVALVFTAPKDQSHVAASPLIGPGFQGVAVTGNLW